ncbi:prolipoprotein diacylglyceryl transferase, partial [Burkholderia multivorans]
DDGSDHPSAPTPGQADDASPRRADRPSPRSDRRQRRGRGEDEKPGFGFFGAVTSAISIIPDVRSRSRGTEDEKSGQ